MLGICGERPIVRLRSNLGSRWLGRCSWSSRNPRTSTIEFQRSILADAATLERVVAHEMVHHRDFLAMDAQTIERIKFGIRPSEHGASFRSGAAEINRSMGDGFVTVTSDKAYVQAVNTKQFYLLIIPHGDRFGYQWAARLSPNAEKEVAGAVAKGARLIRTTDDQWCGNAKIKRFGGYNIPKTAEREDALRALYEGV